MTARHTLLLLSLSLLSACDAGSSAAPEPGGDADASDPTAAADASAQDLPAGHDDASTGLGDAGPDATAALPPVTAPGPHGVGFRTMQVTYTPETFDAPRTLDVALWYPTDATEGDLARYLDLLPSERALVDAPPAGDAPYPVVLFSHGNTGIEVQNSFLTEHLASHGWLVAAPRHTGNSLLDFDQALLPIMFLLRPMDLVTTLDTLYDGLDPGDPLAGRASDTVVAAGHSFGGYTTLAVGGVRIDVPAIDAACAADTTGACDDWTEPRRQLALAGFFDERVDLLVPMAPWRVEGVVPVGGTDTIALPTLLITAALDETTPNLEDGDPIWQGFSAPHHLRADFATAGHFTFSIACELGFPEGDGCGPDYLPVEEAYDAINALTLAWARHHLFGDDGVLPLLSDPSLTSSDLTFSSP